MDFVTPELLEALIAERRRMAGSARLGAYKGAVRPKGQVRRLTAGALAFVAARIHFESAQLAVGLRNATDAER